MVGTGLAGKLKTKGKKMAATYYDHAMNHANPAEAQAVAAVRRNAIDEGTACRVEANWPNQGRFYWDGGRYDAISLARELVLNRAENVILTRPDGREMSAAEIRELHY